MTDALGRLAGTWKSPYPGCKDVVRFDVGGGRLYGFIHGRAFARELLIGDVAETDAGLVFQLRADGKPVRATIGQDGILAMEAGGKVFMFKRLEVQR
jgi:hypothetical protein